MVTESHESHRSAFFTEVIKDLQRALIKVHKPSTGRRHRKPPSA